MFARLLPFVLVLAATPAAAGDWDELYRQEAERIAPQADRVSRAGDVLRLALAGGGRFELVNPPGFCDDAADCDVYSFLGYDDALAAYVVVLSHWESGEVVLVDGRSGRQTRITDLPHLHLHHGPAIRDLDGARDEARKVGGEEEDHVRHFRRPRHAL